MRIDEAAREELVHHLEHVLHEEGLQGILQAQLENSCVSGVAYKSGGGALIVQQTHVRRLTQRRRQQQRRRQIQNSALGQNTTTAIHRFNPNRLQKHHPVEPLPEM